MVGKSERLVDVDRRVSGRQTAILGGTGALSLNRYKITILKTNVNYFGWEGAFLMSQNLPHFLIDQKRENFATSQFASLGHNRSTPTSNWPV